MIRSVLFEADWFFYWKLQDVKCWHFLKQTNNGATPECPNHLRTSHWKTTFMMDVEDIKLSAFFLCQNHSSMFLFILLFCMVISRHGKLLYLNTDYKVFKNFHLDFLKEKLAFISITEQFSNLISVILIRIRKQTYILEFLKCAQLKDERWI